MTRAGSAGLNIAVIRLGAAQEILESLPLTTEVRERWRRWGALRVVVLAILHERGPVLDDGQRARLLDSVSTLAWEVDDLRERLASHLAWPKPGSERAVEQRAEGIRRPSEGPKSQ